MIRRIWTWLKCRERADVLAFVHAQKVRIETATVIAAAWRASEEKAGGPMPGFFRMPPKKLAQHALADADAIIQRALNGDTQEDDA